MKRPWLWVLPAFLLLTLTVVWGKDSVELGDLAVVVGLGLEEGPAGLNMVIEVASQPGGEGPGESKIFSAAGEDFQACSQQLSQQLERQLFWHDCALLLINRELTEKQRYLAELYSRKLLSPETLVVEYGGSGEKLLSADFGESDFIAIGLAGSLDKQSGQTALTLAEALRQPTLPWPQVDIDGNEVRIDE